MPSEITVHVNRGSTDMLEAAVDAVETDESLVLELRGHERPAHVHCRLDGDLERVATIERTNHYIEPESATSVPIPIDSGSIDDPVDGHLEVVTGYGSESVTIAVTVRPPPPTIDVDESLSQPNRDQSPQSTSDHLLEGIETSRVDPATLLIVALGVLAVAIATVTAATIGGFVALVGAVIVLGGVSVALWLLFA